MTTVLISDCILRADETPVPTPIAAQTAMTEAQPEVTPETREEKPRLSNPTPVSTEVNPAVQAPGANSKPSQGEGEKAPVEARPTAVPDFSLPEVVITGENELTIGAQRLDRTESDVTLGSHDLSAAQRAVNDLPGLDKTFTALSTEESGPAQDTALILHAGGGTPSTYGGWGLFGQQFKDFQYLLSGFYSTWGGEAAGNGFDGDSKYRFGLETNLFSTEPLSFHLRASYGQTTADLPYQGSFQESHEGLDLGLDAKWKVTDLVQAQAVLSQQSVTLDYFDAGSQEWEGRLKFSADDVDPFFNRFSADLGGRSASAQGNLAGPGGYQWGWLAAQAYLKASETVGLTAKLQVQAGNGLELPLKVFPALDLMWRAFQSSQLDLYWQTDRYADGFYQTFMDTEHASPYLGFPSPTEVTSEFGGRFTQKVAENIVASVSGSVAQMDNYHQWSDIDPQIPDYIQGYMTLPNVQIARAGANIQWNFMKYWQLAAAYQWTQGTNNSGGGLNFTNLPQNKGTLSLYRGDEKLETRLSLVGATERYAFETPNSPLLGSYASLNLNATYHWTKELSLWLDGDNLLGTAYEIQPGYLEPEVHVRAGVEVVF